ncbi:Rpn family recombination-promoting nuclease/putative transposase [Algivirga pacifica]|uniref:Rpn family recombination-promoting nuclease/putative transposase n=1 Tax=Algivirga pacifica TaxID=1162670 RepID=A0ABP9DDL4_9BACT
MDIGKYINPFTDYGFKKLFASERHKNLLIDFLNELLIGKESNIKDITYLKNEQEGAGEEDRKAIFDIFCENEEGERFIVELQKAKQTYFKGRMVYYSTFPIQAQAKKGNWDYQLKAVYSIAILDFELNDTDLPKEDYYHEIALCNVKTGKVFYRKLSYIFLEMPKFTKALEELQTHFDKWMYLLKNLNRLDRIPVSLRERVFEEVFEVLEIAKMLKEEYIMYEDSLKQYRDLKNSLDTAREEGIEIGEERRMIKVVHQCLQAGMNEQQIAELFHLSLEKVEELKKKKHDG